MTKVRGFQVISKYQNKGIQLPKRSTEASAGYDIRSNETVTIPSFLRKNKTASNILSDYSKRVSGALADNAIRHGDKSYLDYFSKNYAHLAHKLFKMTKPVLVHTGIKTYFPKHEMLMIFNRSSNPVKRGLYLANGVGVIDSDYYNNPSNEGELMGEFVNWSPCDYTVHRGDRIMQGVFAPYLLADGDNATGKRKGGVGSTGK